MYNASPAFNWRDPYFTNCSTTCSIATLVRGYQKRSQCSQKQQRTDEEGRCRGQRAVQRLPVADATDERKENQNRSVTAYQQGRAPAFRPETREESSAGTVSVKGESDVLLVQL